MSANKYTTETKLEIFGTLCEFWTVSEILAMFPDLNMTQSSGYTFLSRNHLTTFKRAFIDRRKTNELKFKYHEEELKAKSLNDLRTSLKDQGLLDDYAWNIHQ